MPEVSMRPMSARRRLACIAFGALFAATAAAQDYPARPVRLIVPIGPGGGTDILGRHVAQKLGERLRQSVVVENRPGAGSLVGTEYAARPRPTATPSSSAASSTW